MVVHPLGALGGSDKRCLLDSLEFVWWWLLFAAVGLLG